MYWTLGLKTNDSEVVCIFTHSYNTNDVAYFLLEDLMILMPTTGTFLFILMGR